MHAQVGAFQSQSARPGAGWQQRLLAVIRICIQPSPSLPAQKGTIRQPAKQMRFPYIRQTLITFPMLSLFLCVLPQPEPKSWDGRGGGGEGASGGGVRVQPSKASPPLALHTHREAFAATETSHLVRLQTTLQVETLSEMSCKH